MNSVQKKKKEFQLLPIHGVLYTGHNMHAAEKSGGQIILRDKIKKAAVSCIPDFFPKETE